jgi:hypothetical protein
MSDISTLSDSDVVEIVRSSDKEAYAEIIKRYQTKLMRYASYIMGDEHKELMWCRKGLLKRMLT